MYYRSSQNIDRWVLYFYSRCLARQKMFFSSNALRGYSVFRHICGDGWSMSPSVPSINFCGCFPASRDDAGSSETRYSNLGKYSFWGHVSARCQLLVFARHATYWLCPLLQFADIRSDFPASRATMIGRPILGRGTVLSDIADCIVG